MPTEAFSQAIAALGDESSEGGSESVDSGVQATDGLSSQPEETTENVSSSEPMEAVTEGSEAPPRPGGEQGAVEAAEPAEALEESGEWSPTGRSVPLNRFQEVIAQRNSLRGEMATYQRQMEQLQQAQQVASFMQPQQQPQSTPDQYGGTDEDAYLDQLLGLGDGQPAQAAPQQSNEVPGWASDLRGQFEQFQDYIGKQQLQQTVTELQSVYPDVPDWALHQALAVGLDPEQAALQFQTYANGLRGPAAAPAGVPVAAAPPMVAPRPNSAPVATETAEQALSAADLADPKKRKNLALQALEKVPFP
jgi:hypothetical protein